MEPNQLFDTGDQTFSFESHGVTLYVQRLAIAGHTAYRIEFSSTRSPITITRALGANGNFFWTAVPEGQNREQEARGVGMLIEQYLKK